MNSGASTMPTNTLAATPSPTAPPTPMDFSNPEGEAPDYPGQDAPIGEYGCQRTHDNNQGQCAKGEHEACAGLGFLEGQRSTTEIAEYECSACIGGLL